MFTMYTLPAHHECIKYGTRTKTRLNPFGHIPRGLPRTRLEGYHTPLSAAEEFIARSRDLVFYLQVDSITTQGNEGQDIW
jgi:hypothetical protein